MAFTFFMRDQHTLDHTVNHVIPYVTGRSRIKIWDAGSALGQETYTVAILFAEKMNKFGFKNLHIDATDYDCQNNFGDIVTEAVYPKEELARIPEELFSKYFETEEKSGQCRVVEQLRNIVTFQYHDLTTLKPIGSDYSLVVCKNVLLHLQYDQRVEVMKMFHTALAPGGYFVSEHTQKLPKEVVHLFEQVVDDAQLYKKI